MERIAGLATIPQREATLQAVINSIAPQVDRVYVALNGYSKIPEWFHNLRNVIPEITDNSRGDGFKFLHANIFDAIYFGCDDDIVYPYGYFDYLQAGIARYDALVSLHGRIYPRPITDFRRFIGNYRCLNTVPADVRVDLVGSGVCGFSTNRLKIYVEDFKIANMADVWLCGKAQEQGVPRWVLKHNVNYLEHISNPVTIWQSRKDKSQETALLREFLR